MDVAESDEVGSSSGGDHEDKTVERSLYSKNSNRATDYLTPNARQAFTKLRQAFTKASILRHFNLEYYIRIETDASGYAISCVLNQLTNSGRWYPVTYYFREMILAKTRYKTHNDKLLAIIEAFKTWQHYQKGYKYKVLVLTNHNNLCYFMKIKNLSSRHVW